MTASPRPQRAIEDLQSFGEELKRTAEELTDELAIKRVALRYQPPVEALDIPSAVLEVWIDGGEERAFAAERRLSEEARALERRTGLPWHSGAIIPHWLP
jgi:hypothetical protein